MASRLDDLTPRKAKVKSVNYRKINKLGFVSTIKRKPGKGRRVRKTKSLLVTPDKSDNNEGDELERLALSVVKNLNLASTPEVDNEDLGEVAKQTITKGKRGINSNVNEVSSVVMDKREEEKQAMRRRIAEMEEEVQRREEERKRQEDDEFQDLKRRMEQLERKLSASNPQTKEEQPKSRVREKSEGTLNSIKSCENPVDVVNVFSNSKIDPVLPDLEKIQELLNVTERRAKPKKAKKSKKKRSRRYTSDSSSSDSETSSDETSDSDSDEETDRREKRNSKSSKKVKSGFYAKPSNSKIISNKLFAHVALDDEIGGEKDFDSLSFNLLVAGELEIILSNDISNKERDTRLKILRSLAYKHEFLSREEILKQYANFVKKVEKGKFRWGSKSSIRCFEQQLLYNISIQSKKKQVITQGKNTSTNKDDNRKKYCLEFNRGQCEHDKASRRSSTG